MPTPTVTVLDPTGTARDVPADQVDAALQNGGKRAVKMADPTGQQRWVPEDQVEAAKSAGGKLAAGGDGFLGSFADSSGLSSIGHLIMHPRAAASNVIDLASDVVHGRPASDANPIVQAVQSAAHGVTDNFTKGVADYKKSGLSLQTRRDFANSVPMVGGVLQKAEEQTDAGNNTGAMGTMLGLGAAAVAPKLIPKVLEAAPAAARALGEAPAAALKSAAKVVGGGKLDTTIAGDTVTPRDLYATAQKMGVNLDTSQATNSAVANAAKSTTEHSLGGSDIFHENNAANVNALHVEAERIQDAAAPDSQLSREDFGNVARTRLLEDQEAQNQAAGKLYDELTNSVGTKQPNVAGVVTQAQKIIAENQGYYDKHPEMLKGGTKTAWDIINKLGETPEAKPPTVKLSSILDEAGKPYTTEIPGKPALKDTWSDQHKLRSDLMDITRGPEFIGDRPIGWIKQMTSAVDKAMTEGGSQLSGEDVQKFRDAGDIYERMKQTYDNPQSKLYHVVRSPDGLTAANTLSSIKPAVARQIAAAAPDLAPHLQQQTISRILNPAGNDVPDLKNLPTRFGRMQKEQLRGVLTPEQLQQLDDLSRVTRKVNFDSNTSGTAKVLQKTQELGAIRTGLDFAGEKLTEGKPIQAVVGGAARVGAVAIKRPIAKLLTNPRFTEAVMNATKGSEGWANKGTAKILDHVSTDASSGLTAEDLTALRSTSEGKKLLIDASGRTAGSAGMNAVVKKLAALKTRSMYRQGKGSEQ